MNPFIDDEMWNDINRHVVSITALPIYENGIEGKYSDFIFLGVICHVQDVDNPLKNTYGCTVTLKFQSTFDDSFDYHVLDSSGNITVIGEIS